MQVNVKSYVTAGVAVVGAGAIAMTPVAPPPDTFEGGSRTHEVNLLATTQNVQAGQNLAAQAALLPGGDPVTVLRAFIEGTLAAYVAPGPRPYVPVTGPIDGLVRIGEGVAASGLRFGTAAILTPLGFVGLAAAIAGGSGQQALTDLITNIVDGPLWVADPVLYGLRDALPAPLGGPGGFIESFRNQLWSATEEINAGLLDPAAAVRAFVDGALYAFAAPGPRAYSPPTGPIDGLSRIGEGVIASGLRLVAATVLVPLRFVGLAVAIAEGKGPEAVADLITSLVDGPLWVADPVLYGLRDALPAPFGGPGAVVESVRNGVWSGTEQINAAVRSILGLPPTPAAAASLLNSQSAGINSFSEPSITSIPDPHARLLTQPDDEKQETLPQGPSADTSGTVNPAGDSGGVDPGDGTDPVGPAVVKPVTEINKLQIDKLQKPVRNLVRESLNFSTRAHTTPTQGTAGSDVDEVAASTPAQPEAPQTGPDTATETGAGAPAQANSGSPADSTNE